MRKTSKGEGSSNYNRCTMAKEQLKNKKKAKWMNQWMIKIYDVYVVRIFNYIDILDH